jgi:hypothetical protein
LTPQRLGRMMARRQRRAKEAVMRNISLTTAGAFCALVLVAGFVIGIVLMASGGVQVLIPETGKDVLVTISHATPIALALELAPDYTAANEATQASLAATFDTFAEFCLLMNYFGDIFVWGVTTPLFAIAVLKTRVVPRWIGWVGMVAALFAGWLGLLSPISSIVENISTIGFFAFFIFMASLGVALLRRRTAAETRSRP